MAWMKCKYCNKRISDKVKKCPKCNKRLTESKISMDKKFVRELLLKGLYVVVQIILCFLLVICSKAVLYSEYVNHLFIIIGISLVVLINVVIVGRKLIIDRKFSVYSVLLAIVVVSSLLFSLFYLGKSINAFRYDNSKEVLSLSENFSIEESKKIKVQIENIFEYDFDNVSSRDVVVGSFYGEDDNFVLFLDDSYGNYRLKYYVVMDGSKISDVYWEYDENTKFYLVKDGEKTDDFEYYYAMYIVRSLIGEEKIIGLATIEDAVEEKVNGKFGEAAATIYTYDQLHYVAYQNRFYMQCYVENMDYYGNMGRTDFTIDFIKSENKKNKKVWYYGDSSFDYVNWNVNI